MLSKWIESKLASDAGTPKRFNKGRVTWEFVKILSEPKEREGDILF